MLPQKEALQRLAKASFFTEEAAVDDLATAHFCDKMLIDKGLFEIAKV